MKDQSYSVFPLSDLVKDLGKIRTQEYLGTFRPYKDSDAGVFLSKKALMMEDRDLSRTYLAMDSNDEIMGFISLRIKCLSIPEKSLLSDRMIQDMFIDPKTGVVQAFLLAQIARSESSHHGFGIELINLAMDVFEKAKSLVGCRLVRIDCEDELIPYYKSNGFTMVRTNEDGTLNQMLTFVSPLDAEC